MIDPTYPTNAVTGGPVVGDPYARYEPADPPARATWMDRVDAGRWAFFGGLAGGMLILTAAFVTALFLTAMATFAGTVPTWDWFGDGADGDRADSGWPEVPIFIGVWGLVTGGAVILAALATKERPDSSAMPGLVMVVAGLASFFAMGGFIVGGLLAIVAGVLAMAGSRSVWRVRAPRVRDREFA